MSREAHVRFWESPRVRFPRATRQIRMGQYFFGDIANEGILLYAGEKLDFAKPKALKRVLSWVALLCRARAAQPCCLFAAPGGRTLLPRRRARAHRLQRAHARPRRPQQQGRRAAPAPGRRPAQDRARRRAAFRPVAQSIHRRALFEIVSHQPGRAGDPVRARARAGSARA